MPTIKTPLSQREDSQKPKRNRKTFPTSKEVREALENVNETDKKMLKIDETTYIVVDKSKIDTPEKQGHYLVIAPKSFPKNCKVVVAEFYEDNNTFYSESSDCPIEDVTHWRSIL